jgi:uncharacterized protein (DUF2236 family)
MGIPSAADPVAVVSESESEALRARVARGAADAVAGAFGPESVTWRIHRESALFLGAARAALLQLAHPWVAAAIAQHSTVLDRPIARFHNTFRVVFTMVFGSLDQALGAAGHLFSLHTRIRGEMPQGVAGWARGTPYQANEAAALRWVYATLIETAVMAYEWALGPLTGDEREQYYAESKVLAGLFSVPTAALPEDWEAFRAYNRAMHDSDALGVSPGAREMAHKLLAGAGSWIHPPHWYRALTAEWMPPQLREEFGLAVDARAVERAHRLFPGIYRRTPAPLRFTGPWREAQDRLAGRKIRYLARLSNRFWIGQERMPFGK